MNSSITMNAYAKINSSLEVLRSVRTDITIFCPFMQDLDFTM